MASAVSSIVDGSGSRVRAVLFEVCMVPLNAGHWPLDADPDR
jgi:hypothetical protein